MTVTAWGVDPSYKLLVLFFADVFCRLDRSAVCQTIIYIIYNCLSVADAAVQSLC